jgi:hypothetical protein
MTPDSTCSKGSDDALPARDLELVRNPHAYCGGGLRPESLAATTWRYSLHENAVTWRDGAPRSAAGSGHGETALAGLRSTPGTGPAATPDWFGSTTRVRFAEHGCLAVTAARRHVALLRWQNSTAIDARSQQDRCQALCRVAITGSRRTGWTWQPEAHLVKLLTKAIGQENLPTQWEDPS